MNCPHCTCEISLFDLKSLDEKELQSLRGLVSLALRKAPPKAGPGRPKGKPKWRVAK